MPYSSSEPAASKSPVEMRYTIDVDGPASWSEPDPYTLGVWREATPTRLRLRSLRLEGCRGHQRRVPHIAGTPRGIRR